MDDEWWTKVDKRFVTTACESNKHLLCDGCDCPHHKGTLRHIIYSRVNHSFPETCTNWYVLGPYTNWMCYAFDTWTQAFDYWERARHIRLNYVPDWNGTYSPDRN